MALVNDHEEADGNTTHTNIFSQHDVTRTEHNPYRQ